MSTRFFFIILFFLLLTGLSATPAAALTDQKTIDEIQEQLNRPSTRIRIPGVDFTKTSDIPVTQEGAKKFIHVPYLGELMAALFRYGVAVAGIIATIMIIIAGVQRIMAGGNANQVTVSKRRLIQAVTGLIIAVSSYVILYTINPNLVEFKNIKVLYVDEIVEPEFEIEHLIGNTNFTTNIGRVDGDNIRGNGRFSVATAHIKDLKEVAEIMAKDNFGVIITSGYRPLEEQIRLIRQNCQNPPGSGSCNPKPDRPTTCILKENNPANCPHTTGYAVDIWGAKQEGGSWKQCIFQSECSRDKSSDACRTNTCHKKLIEAMKSKGFCVLDTEAWHFEKPALSKGACN